MIDQRGFIFPSEIKRREDRLSPKRRSAEAADNMIRPEEESVLALSSGESRRRGRRSAVGATEEEASAFVGARIQGERF